MMVYKTAVIVIGGGYFGTSITYHLAKQGIKTMLLEQGDLASGSSGANFGNIQVQDAEPGLSLELTLRSFAMWQTLKDEIGYDLDFRPKGSLLLATSEQEWQSLQELQRQKIAQGLSCQFLSASDIQTVEPYLCVQHGCGATLSVEASINPFKLVYGMAARARAWGAEIWQHTEVLDFLTAGDNITGVVTSRGQIESEFIVLAAGAWSQHLAAKLELELPIRYIRAEAVVTEALPKMLRNYFSLASFFAEAHTGAGAKTSLCCTQTAAGNLLLGETGRPPGPYPGDEEKNSSSLEHLTGIYREVRALFPSFLKHRLLRSWQTRSPYTEKNRPVFGLVGYKNLLVAAGFKSAVIMLPLVGRTAAALVRKGSVDFDLQEFSLL